MPDLLTHLNILEIASLFYIKRGAALSAIPPFLFVLPVECKSFLDDLLSKIACKECAQMLWEDSGGNL